MKKRDNKTLRKQLSLTEDMLLKIKNGKGGSKTLKYIVDNKDALSKAGLAGDSLVKVAANNGGSKTLEYIVDNKNALSKAGLAGDNLVKVAAHDGGSKTLEYILAEYLSQQRDNSLSEDNVENYSLATPEQELLGSLLTPALLHE